MKTKTLLNLIKITAILLIILGTIHNIATFTPLIQGSLAQVHPLAKKVWLYMSIVTGSAFILCGILLYIICQGITEKSKSALQSMYAISIFLLIMGIGSTLVMPTNPFAYMSLLLGIFSFVICIVTMNLYRKF